MSCTTHALVTGGGGFLGRYIVELLLDRGSRVTVFARGAYPDLGQLGAQLVRGDLADLDALTQACRGVDIVYHVAAKAGLWGPWDEFYRANVTGTENVIAACRARGVPRLVYTSTPSVVFDNHPHQGVDESLPYPDRYETHLALTLEKKKKWLELTLAQVEPEYEGAKQGMYRKEGELIFLQAQKDDPVPPEEIARVEQELLGLNHHVAQMSAHINQLKGEIGATDFYYRLYVVGLTDPMVSQSVCL